MRSTLLPLLALACAGGPPSSPDDLASLEKGDEGDEADAPSEPAIAVECLDADCATGWASLVPEPEGPVSWRVDGEPRGESAGVKLDTGVAALRMLEAEVEGVVVAQAVVQTFHERGDLGGPQTVVLGVGGTCSSFRIQTVGGCITNTLNVRFGTSGAPDVVFQTSPPPTALVLPGQALAAWWPDGTMPANLLWLSALDGLGFVFSLPQGTSVWLTADHTRGDGSTDRLLAGEAFCSRDGVPSVAP